MRAPPDWARPRTRPAVGLADHPNRMMNGCSYRSMAKTDRDACAAACATDAACQGYSLNKVTRTCELKHTLTALRRDPLWESGTPSTGPASGASIRATGLVVYPANGDAARDFKLVGRLIDEAKAELDECSNRCKADQACVALDWGRRRIVQAIFRGDRVAFAVGAGGSLHGPDQEAVVPRWAGKIARRARCREPEVRSEAAANATRQLQESGHWPPLSGSSLAALRAGCRASPRLLACRAYMMAASGRSAFTRRAATRRLPRPR